MDLVLRVLDDAVLDNAWARIVPLAAFSNDLHFPNGTKFAMPFVADSKWAQLVSYLPYPPHVLQNTLEDLHTPSAAVSAWPRDYMPRQIISLLILTFIGTHLLYFIFATFSYYFLFNHDMMRHPRFLPNQVALEIKTSLIAFPVLTILTVPWFQAEVMGHTKLYDGFDTYGYWYLAASVPLFLFFTDYCIYWIHRWLHLPIFYKHLHKPHHKWIIPTPFASHAFHPFDGYMQGLPYHIAVYIIPMNRILYLGLFVGVNIWTILIHDSDMVTGHFLEKFINGPAHHTLHHMYFTVNYGQYFTWADRAYNSYRQPESSLDPLLEVTKLDEHSQAQDSKKKIE